MVDAIVVGLIVAGAVGYIVYRYAFKKTGGCSCGCGSAGKSKGGNCTGGQSASSCCGSK